jgi:hypothetical protein
MKAVVFGFIVAATLMAAIPDCSLAPGWQQAGPRRTFEGESLYEYMNGNSEGYLIYGFKKMEGVTCKKGQDTVNIDVSDMGDPESAYGIFTANRDVRGPVEKIGMAGQIGERKATSAKDRFYLEIAAEPEKDHTASLRELITALEKQVPGRTAPPDAIGWFADAKIQVGYPRLVPQSVLGMRILKRGYVAHYDGGAKAFVVPESSPAAAAATAGKLRERLGETTPVSLGEAAYTGTDKYLGRMIVFQKGKYVAGYAGVAEGEDLTKLANTVFARLP